MNKTSKDVVKWYCFTCGSNLKQVKIDSIQCFRCKKKGNKIKSEKVDGRTLYHLTDDYSECGHRTFNKRKFKKTKRVMLQCPICGDDFRKIKKENGKDELKIKTTITKDKGVLLSDYVIKLTKTEMMHFYLRGAWGRRSVLVRKLQLKAGDKLLFTIRKIK